jgi:hypothetical protein
MPAPRTGYAVAVIPDDGAGRPLTPRERAALADLERRLLLDVRSPARPVRAVRAAPVRIPPGRGPRPVPGAAVPLGALLVAGCLLVGAVVAAGGGLLGAAAVLASVVVTALLWPLLPAALGGPVRPRRRRRWARVPPWLTGAR